MLCWPMAALPLSPTCVIFPSPFTPPMIPCPVSALTKESKDPSGAFPWLIISCDLQSSRGLGDALREYKALCSCRLLISPFSSNSTGFPFLGFFFPHTLKGSDSDLHCRLSSGQPS